MALSAKGSTIIALFIAWAMSGSINAPAVSVDLDGAKSFDQLLGEANKTKTDI